MHVKFYINPATKTSYLYSIQKNSSILAGLDVYVMGHNYEFNDTDKKSLIDVQTINRPGIVSSLQNVLVSNLDDRIVLGASDIQIYLNDKPDVITSIVLANKTQPILCITVKHTETFGGNTLFGFSRHSSKIVTVPKTGDSATTSGVLIKNVDNGGRSFKPTPQPLNRTNITLAPEEDLDAAWISDKYAASKDISITGKPHPLTGDLVTLKGESAINQSLKNILLANSYERPYTSQQVAGNISSLLFEFNDAITADELRTGITMAVTKHEPRISLIDVLVQSHPEKYSMLVKIIYMIKTTDVTHEFNLILDRA